MKVDQGRLWLAQLQSLEAAVKDVPQDSLWNNSGLVLATLAQIIQNFEKDLQDLEKAEKTLLATETGVEEGTQVAVTLIRKYHMLGRAPSLAAFCAFAVESLAPLMPDNLRCAVLAAGVLGQIENDIGYHNNMHFFKVLLATARLIAAHNDIYSGTQRAFDAGQVALLLIAACVHDLGHDGLGNTIRGVFYQGRLEKRSFALARPYLEAAGLSDEKMLAELKSMILATEVTPLDDPGNPMNQMKAAYRFHYMGEKTRTHTLNLDPDLARLELDARLSMMALLLHEADIATSAGLTYELTKYETGIYMGEIGTKQARPQHIVDFLEQVCQRRFLSDAGQRLHSANMARIYALAQEDVKNGDDIFPAPEHSDFLLLHSRLGESLKTIN